MSDSITQRLFGLVYNKTLQSAVVFGGMGVASAIGNILLAYTLSKEEYATIALFVTIIAITNGLGPLGLNIYVNRHRVSADFTLLTVGIVASTLVALIAVLAGGFVYKLSLPMLVLLGSSVISGCVTVLAAACLQSLEYFNLSNFVYQCSNIALLTTGLFAFIWPDVDAILIVHAILIILFAIFVWVCIFQRQATPFRYLWSCIPECIGLFGISTGYVILMGLERLLTPLVLGIEDFAVLNILNTVVFSLYRMIQVGIITTLLPVLARVQPISLFAVIFKECKTVAPICVLLTVFLWYATPPVLVHVLGKEYMVEPELMVACLFGGLVRVTTGFAEASIKARGGGHMLAAANGLSWLSIGLAAFAGWYGASAGGLAGLVVGVSVVWLIKSIMTFGLIWIYIGDR